MRLQTKKPVGTGFSTANYNPYFKLNMGGFSNE
jgi:hypothetical protein